MGRKKMPEVDAMATRERIIETAEMFFRLVGYSKTTVADIAKDLAMSPSNVYRYFPTKAHINEEICDRLVRGIEACCVGSMARHGTLRERIKAFIFMYHRSLKKSILKDNQLYDMICVAMEQNWPVIQSHSTRIQSMLAALLDQGIVEGEFKNIDSCKMARGIHESIAVFTYPPLLARWVNDFADAAQEDNVEEQLDFILDLAFHGICS